MLLGVFLVFQARLRQPLMRLGIFRAPNLAAANIAQFLLGAAWIPMFFFINLYLQQVLGLGAFASGAALLPLTVTIMVGMVAAAPRLIARLRPQGDDRCGPGHPGGRTGVALLIRPDGSSPSTSCPRPWSPRPAWRWHSSPPWAGTVLGRTRRRRTGGRHRQHQLPGRVRSRPGRDDGGRRGVRRRQIGDVASPSQRVLRRPLGAAAIAGVGALIAGAWLRTPTPRRSAEQPQKEAVAA